MSATATTGEEVKGGGEGGEGLQLAVDTTEKTVAQNPYSALGVDDGDDEDDAEENEGEDRAGEGEKSTDSIANGSFRKQGGRGGNGGGGKGKQPHYLNSSKILTMWACEGRRNNKRGKN